MDSFTLATYIAQLAEAAKREREMVRMEGPQMQPDGTVKVRVTYTGIEQPQTIEWQGNKGDLMNEITVLLEARRTRISS